MFLALLLLGCPSAPRAPDTRAHPPPGDTGDSAAGDTDPEDSGSGETGDTAETADTDDTDTEDTDTAVSCMPVVESIVDLGGALPAATLSHVEGGWSQSVGGASYWVFREAVSASAGTVRGGMAAVLTGPADLGALLTANDADGVPVELLADDPTDDCAPEATWGAVRAGPYSAMAWVANGDDALLFYAKACRDEGTRGFGLARWTPRVGADPRRLRSGTGADAEVLFPVDPETELGVPANFLPGRAALVAEVAGEPYVYAYACNVTFWSIQSCGVGRAAWDEADDPVAWTVWNGSGWTADLEQMAFLFQTTFDGGFSVTWDDAIGAYVAWLPLGATGVGLATAPEPEGPWTTTGIVADPDVDVTDTIAHPELGRPGVAYVTVGSGSALTLWEAHYVCEG